MFLYYDFNKKIMKRWCHRHYLTNPSIIKIRLEQCVYEREVYQISFEDQYIQFFFVIEIFWRQETSILKSDPCKLILFFLFILMASLNNQSAFFYVFNLFLLESAFLFYFDYIRENVVFDSRVIVKQLQKTYIIQLIWYKCAHVCISILSRNTCNFCFHFLLIHYIFHVLPSFIPARLRYSCFHGIFISFEQIYLPNILSTGREFAIQYRAGN